MATQQEVVDLIAEMAMEVNQSHVDWGMLAVEEKTAYNMMALSTLDNKGLDDGIIARAVVTALLVENMVLNIKLLQQSKAK